MSKVKAFSFVYLNYYYEIMSRYYAEFFDGEESVSRRFNKHLK